MDHSTIICFIIVRLSKTKSFNYQLKGMVIISLLEMLLVIYRRFIISTTYSLVYKYLSEMVTNLPFYIIYLFFFTLD